MKKIIASSISYKGREEKDPAEIIKKDPGAWAKIINNAEQYVKRANNV
jgi:hypothetical protein